MTYPIVLCHGFIRMDLLWHRALAIDNADSIIKDRWHYFRGIRTCLMQHGHLAFHSSVPSAGSLARRTRALKKELLNICAHSGAEKLNLIGHSMGGLDARMMLWEDRHQGQIRSKIASLTTIGTPHEGSSYADWSFRYLKPVPAGALRLGIDLRGMHDLLCARRQPFNRAPRVMDYERTLSRKIKFQAFAGTQDFDDIHAVLQPSYAIIRKKEGLNDGLVSVDSARWHDDYYAGEISGTDHLNMIGWWNPGRLLSGERPGRFRKKICQFYLSLAATLP